MPCRFLKNDTFLYHKKCQINFFKGNDLFSVVPRVTAVLASNSISAVTPHGVLLFLTLSSSPSSLGICIFSPRRIDDAKFVSLT